VTGQTVNKKRYYLYNPDANGFAGVGFSLADNDKITRIHFNDEPLSATWKPRSCHIFDDNPPTDGDFPSLSNFNEIPLMSERAWTALRPLIGYCCEALPIIHPSGEAYFIVHVMNTIDALDADASNVRRHEGPKPEDRRIYRIDRYAFRNKMLRGQHLFKLPHLSGSELIVDDEFRRAVEANRLRGLLFRELPLNDSRG